MSSNNGWGFKEDKFKPLDDVSLFDYTKMDYSRILIRQSYNQLTLIEGYKNNGESVDFCNNSIHLYLLLLKIELFLKGMYANFHEAYDVSKYRTTLLDYGHNIATPLEDIREGIDAIPCTQFTRDLCSKLTENIDRSFQKCITDYVQLRYHIQPNNRGKLFSGIAQEMEEIYDLAKSVITAEHERKT